MPIPKRSKKLETTCANPQEQTKNHSSNDFNSSASKIKQWIVVLWIFAAIICIIASIADNSSKSSNLSTTPKTTTKNSFEKDWYCKWSDWNRYEKPIHWYCDWGRTPLWRICNTWYYSKSEGNKTRLNSSWYCAANCSNFSCPSYACSSLESSMNLQISKLNNMYVNQYSQASVNSYNAQVNAANEATEKYNRCLSEECRCSY